MGGRTGVAAGIISIFCCAVGVRAQVVGGRMGAPPLRKLVSMTVSPSQVKHAQFPSMGTPTVTLTFDRALEGSAASDTVWLQSTAPDLVSPPHPVPAGQSAPGDGYVTVLRNEKTSVFPVYVHPSLLSASKVVSLRATYGSSVASTSLTVLVVPNRLVSLTAAPVELANGNYPGGSGPQFTLTLADTAATVVRGADGKPTLSGERVILDVSRSDLMTLPDKSVVVPFGKTSIAFRTSVQYSDKVQSPQKVTVTARSSGGTLTTTVLILPQPPYRVTSFQVNPATYRVGQSAQPPGVTLALDRAVTAPPGVLPYRHKIAIVSSASDVAEVATMEVPIGSSGASGFVNLKGEVASPRDVTFTPAGGDPGVQGRLQIQPIQLKSFRLPMQPPQPLYIGTVPDGLGLVEIDAPNMTSSVPVRLTSMEPDVLNFTQTYESTPAQHLATIPRASASANFHVWAMPATLRKTYVGEDRQVTIAAEYGGQRLTTVVPVIWPRAIASLTVAPPNASGVSAATVTLDRPAPAAGMQLSINSSNRAAFQSLPSVVPVGGGQTSATFSLALKAPRASGVTITVTGTPYWNTSATATVPAN